MRVRLSNALLVLVLLAAAPTAFAAERAQQSDPRYLPRPATESPTTTSGNSSRVAAALGRSAFRPRVR